MKKRSSKKFFASLFVSVLSIGFVVTSSTVSAATAHPAPYPIIDEWRYGVSDNYGYSNYYVQSPNNIGSRSSVTNFFGVVKAADAKKYGWALSSAHKNLYDIRLNAYWNYFKF